MSNNNKRKNMSNSFDFKNKLIQNDENSKE